MQVAAVILSHAPSPNRSRTWRRKLQKTLSIGLAGAINGVRMRSWYADTESGDLFELAADCGVPVFETSFTNSDETRQLFREAHVELGLSLGNGYIPPSVFNIPTYGMVNVHTEVLPAFQGAQSVIWPIYEGVSEVGFTIHQVNARIDAGDILLRKSMPMQLHSTLRATVECNMDRIRRLVPDAVCEVCANYVALKSTAQCQNGGRRYTTPSIWQYLRMKRNHSRMYRSSPQKQ